MDFVKIDYTGRLEDGTVFVTTDSKIAKENKIYEEGVVYKPKVLIFGEKYDPISKKILESLKSCKVNDKKRIIIPKELTAKYDPKLVSVLPLSAFKKGSKLFPGLIVSYQGKIGKIKSVSGGRVVVDFNPDTAGKKLIYDVEVKGIASTEEEKLNFLISMVFDESENIEGKIITIEKENDEKNIKSKNQEVTKTTNKDKFVEITIPKDKCIDGLILQKKQLLLNNVSKYLNISKIVFKEIWEI